MPLLSVFLCPAPCFPAARIFSAAPAPAPTNPLLSQQVPDLTLVDLPGIVYTDADGKKSDIATHIQALYKRHISKEGCVILACLPVNADARTQEVMAWASEVDPEGKRTLGVVTKIDKAEPGDMTLGARLLGQGRNAWSFKLGAVALRNRAQAELDADSTPAEVTAAENAFFSSHPALAALGAKEASEVLGIAALVRRLVAIQTEAVKKCLPAIARAIGDKLASAQKSLHALPAHCGTQLECLAVFTRLTQELRNRVAEAVAGNYARVHGFAAARRAIEGAAAGSGGGGPAALGALPPSVLALHVMPRLQALLERFAAGVKASGTPVFSAPYRARVAQAMKECAGCSLPDVVSADVFLELVAADAEALRAPAEALLAEVHDYFAGFTDALCSEHFRTFPALEASASGSLREFLGQSLARAAGRVAELVAQEGEPFTMDPHYMEGLRRLRLWQAERTEKAREAGLAGACASTPFTEGVVDSILEGVGVAPPPPGGAKCAPCPLDSEDAFEQALLDTQLKLLCYRKIVHKRFVDQVACLVRFHFPRRLRDEAADGLQRAVLATGPKGKLGDGLVALMAEPPEVGRERSGLTAAVARLSKAQAELRRGGLEAFSQAPPPPIAFAKGGAAATPLETASPRAA